MKKIILLLAIFSLQCSENENGKLTLEKADHKFRIGDYVGAQSIYVDLISTKGSLAKVGAGWCALFLNDYPSASDYFSDASDDSLKDGYAGWAFSLWAQNQPSKVIGKIDWILAQEPDYRFSLDENIGSTQLIWLQSESYLQLGNYARCLEWVKKIDPAFSADLNDSRNIANILLSKLQSLGNANPI